MADDQTEQYEKTEEPTQKKLDDAHKKGDVTKSQEVNHWFMILAATIIVLMLAPSFMGDIVQALSPYIEGPDLIATDGNGLRSTARATLEAIALALAPVMVILLIMAAAPGVLQSGFLISPERIQPKLEKISLLKGFKRRFSLKALMDFAKGLLKLAIVGSALAILLIPEFDNLPQLTTLETISLLQVLQSLAARVLIAVLAIMTIIAGIDFMYQRFEHMKGMRMSRREVKDELKQTEGDPIVKARLRQIRMERARRRMMAAVPEADVVVTNPEHFAVALSYKPEEMAAPRLVAKGVDHLALRIREVAKEHDVPVVQNPPLARALFETAEIDEEIPPAHYRAVAEVIGYIMRLKGGISRQGVQPR